MTDDFSKLSAAEQKAHIFNLMKIAGIDSIIDIDGLQEDSPETPVHPTDPVQLRRIRAKQERQNFDNWLRLQSDHPAIITKAYLDLCFQTYSRIMDSIVDFRETSDEVSIYLVAEKGAQTGRRHEWKTEIGERMIRDVRRMRLVHVRAHYPNGLFIDVSLDALFRLIKKFGAAIDGLLLILGCLKSNEITAGLESFKQFSGGLHVSKELFSPGSNLLGKFAGEYNIGVGIGFGTYDPALMLESHNVLPFYEQ